MFAVLVALSSSCLIGSDDGGNTSMTTYVPTALRDDIDLLRLTVFDDDATCNGPEVAGGTPLGGLENIEFGVGDSQSITVSAGIRIFSLLGLAAEVVIARGCTEETIVDEENRDVVIRLEQIPGRPDAGP